LPRSHPPTLITLVRGTVRDHALIARGATVLVAVSGGADSMALLHVLGLLRSKLAFGLFAHGVDHGLRAEAAAELDLAEAFARSLDVPFGRTRVEVATGGNLQARARAARWGALRTAAARLGATRIATGHHADDRAETLLMRILRGSRARQLGVLPPLDGDRIRPMLPARRSDVEAHVRRHRIPYSEDPSNRDPRFLRTRVRFELLPVLERLNPRVVEHMYVLADELSAAGALENDELEGGRGGRGERDGHRPRPSGANGAPGSGIEASMPEMPEAATHAGRLARRGRPAGTASEPSNDRAPAGKTAAGALEKRARTKT
jgi:tRNA(Ile)-lysidine synthase